MLTQQTEALKVSTTEIKEWLIAYLADLLEIEPEQINVETTFARYGLDSSVAVVLTGDLGNLLGKELDLRVIWDYPTIASLAQHLSE
ncbi:MULTISPECIES: acyl carrier protein [unclassified Nostoc]|uniref:acyl carrier protein n=1 Tax=unclassified Nostoc TaxID=2593658 RepID=UPI000B955903|nr:acyl carrier protein [Nostoc sp. 'Peltigera membranacea cyanobiont' 232]OYE06843.1 phosphopantetheine-binding protein [Nostoc sp. 'Peltigera membranacea cyanobiont' 232]